MYGMSPNRNEPRLLGVVVVIIVVWLTLGALAVSTGQIHYSTRPLLSSTPTRKLAQQQPSGPSTQTALQNMSPSVETTTKQVPLHTYLAVLSIFKNEAHGMREWIEHYVAQGVERFVLIDNNSSDMYAKVVRPYVADGLVTLVHAIRAHRQITDYNEAFTMFLKNSTTWVLVVDMDEFMWAPRHNSSIASVLRDLDSRPNHENLAQVRVNYALCVAYDI
jgi:hypothetical protein